MLFAVITLGLMGWSQSPSARTVPYDEAVRCAGVTQAASELEGGESRYGRSLSDAALYWSLVAMQSAQTHGRTSAQADTDQNRARLEAVRQLSAANKATRSQLQSCRQRTPRLG